jgi:hypothetical protein
MASEEKGVVRLEDTDVVTEDEDGDKHVDMASLSKSGNAVDDEE